MRLDEGELEVKRKQAYIAAGFTALAVGGVAVGASLSSGGDAPTSAPKASTHSGSVLTGKPGISGPLLVVKIDNVKPARPATGLNQAGVVYAIQVEGGLSRLMAVYDRPPPVVGPVRSARETDLNLVPQFGRPAFAYSGAFRAIHERLASGAWKRITPATSGGFYRSTNRYAPHNEYLRTSGLTSGLPRPGDLGFRFGPQPTGGAPGAVARASMPAARFGFQHSGGSYAVYMDGSLSPWRAENVIIQVVKISTVRHSHGSAVPYSETRGSGSATIYRDGKKYSGVTWKRGDNTHYYLNGQDFKLKPGRTWIVLV
jgi:hypothetical protein